MTCISRHIKILLHIVTISTLLLMSSVRAMAQHRIRNYTVKNGKMYIELGRDLNEASVDSFIRQFNLSDIGLKQFFKRQGGDSLIKSGWSIEVNNETGFVISKRLMAADITYPGDRISFAEMFP